LIFHKNKCRKIGLAGVLHYIGCTNFKKQLEFSNKPICFIIFLESVFMKKMLLLSNFCILAFVLVFSPVTLKLNAQERIVTPDEGPVIRKVVFTENNVQYRLTATNQTVFSAKYSANAWDRSVQLYMVPPGRTIYDITIRSGVTGNLRDIFLLLDDASVRYFTFNASGLSIQGNISYLAPPAGATTMNNYCKILCSDVLYVAPGCYYGFYVNHLDGTPWINDTTGLNQPAPFVYNMSFDKDFNVLSSSGKGIYKLKAGDSIWSRYTADSNINKLFLSSIFLHRDGKIYIATSYQIYYSSDNGTIWNIDTAGLGSSPQIGRFGDDLSGATYAYNYTSNSLYRKKSGAAEWEKLNYILDTLIKITNKWIYDVGGDNTVELATRYGIYSSSDQGSAWVSSINGILSETINNILFLPGGKMVASTSIGVYTKASPTDNWIRSYPKDNYFYGSIGYGLNILKDNAGNVYIQDSIPYPSFHPRNILKSTDKGITWNYDTLGIGIMSYKNDQNIFFIDSQSREYYGVSAPPSNPALVFTKSGTNPWSSDSSGTNAMSNFGNYQNYFLDFGSDNTGNIFYSSLSQSTTSINLATSWSAFLYKRSLSGINWSMDTNGLNNASIISMQVDPTGKMIIGSLVNGKLSYLYRENNNSWQSLTLPPACVKDAKCLAETSDGALYVHFGSYSYTGKPSTSVKDNRGIFLTTDYGNTWKYAGLDSVLVNNLVADGNDIYACTNRGVYKLEISDLKLPKLTLVNKNIDFDTVSQYKHKDISVTLTNSGIDTLRIINISSSNSAFKAQTVQFSIAPGASKDIVMTFSPTVSGVVTGIINISSNYYPDSIFVRGEGVSFGTPKIQLSTHIMDFGTVDEYKSKDTTFRVSNIGTDSLRITNISSSNPAFTIPVTKDTIAPNGSFTDFHIKFIPALSGTNTGIIRIYSNAATDSIIVTATGNNFGTPVLILSTHILVFDTTDVGKYRDSTITFSNNGNDTLRVIRFMGHGNFIPQVTSFNIPSGGNKDVIIRFNPTIGGQMPVDSMVIVSNAPNDTIYLRGFGKSKLFPCLDPHFIDFGACSKETETIIQIKNITQDTLKISGVSIYNGPFLATLDQDTVAPGDSAKITISFNPTVPLHYNSTLRISCKLGNNYINEYVQVNGYGNFSAPIMVLSTHLINFNKVLAGTIIDTVFKISNIGTDYLYPTKIVSTNSAFTLSPTPSFVDKNSSVDIHLKFSPVDSIQYSCKIIINASDVNPDTIIVQGKGYIIPTSVEDITILNYNLNGIIYPNPANSKATFKFEIEQPSNVSLKLTDILGNQITLIENQYMDSGSHSYEWDASGKPAGVYYYVLQINGRDTACRVRTGKVVVIKE
jgi:hypothetical protein